MLDQTIEVLLVEDNAADAELIRQGLLQSDVDCNLHVVDHGGKAISYLHREGQFSNARRPNLVLLDLGMPQLDGFGVLKHIKSEPSLSDIPVVVLSSQNEPERIQQTYELQANAYMPKPVCFDEFMSLIRDITKYWLTSVSLPGLEPALRPSSQAPNCIGSR